jgi:signal transduction histidine kinase
MVDENTNNVIINIKDDGVGIDKTIAQKLFDIDCEYITEGTNNESGTGIGLKLCKEFVLKNNGDIKVESEIGKGSTFQIIIPAYNFIKPAQKSSPT